jgi:hypothetical protein
MSRSQLLSGVVASAALGLGACASLRVTTDANPNLSLATCHSYSFAREHTVNAGQPGAWGNPLNADRLRADIEANMTARGIPLVDDKAADCVVGYAIGTRQVFNDYYGGWGAGWGMGMGMGMGMGYGGWGGGPGFGGWGYDGPWVEDETRIAVDVFDVQAHKAIWHGAVGQDASDLRGKNAEAKISAAVTAIFEKMPIGTPPPGKKPPPDTVR